MQLSDKDLFVKRLTVYVNFSFYATFILILLFLHTPFLLNSFSENAKGDKLIQNK